MTEKSQYELIEIAKERGCFLREDTGQLVTYDIEVIFRS